MVAAIGAGMDILSLNIEMRYFGPGHIIVGVDNGATIECCKDCLKKRLQSCGCLFHVKVSDTDMRTVL